MIILYLYLAIINALGFLLMLIDKWKAKKNLWRIPEATLIGIAAIGGSIGAIMGMQICRHKTQHLKFMLGLPAILVAQIAIILFCLPHFL